MRSPPLPPSHPVLEVTSIHISHLQTIHGSLEEFLYLHTSQLQPSVFCCHWIFKYKRQSLIFKRQTLTNLSDTSAFIYLFPNTTEGIVIYANFKSKSNSKTHCTSNVIICPLRVIRQCLLSRQVHLFSEKLARKIEIPPLSALVGHLCLQASLGGGMQWISAGDIKAHQYPL